MKILVPTDFSACANNATNFACELAGHLDAEVVLFHSIWPFNTLEPMAYTSTFATEYYEAREKRMKDFTAELKKKFGGSSKISGICKIGFSVQDITETADKEKFTLIVMGTQGAEGISGFAFGSNTGGVIGKTKVPVLAIPKKYTFHQVKNALVYATGLTEKVSKSSKQVLKYILDVFRLPLKTIYVNTKHAEIINKSVPINLAKAMGVDTIDFHAIDSDDIQKAISIFTDSVDAGMLIMVGRKHNFLEKLFIESVSKKVAYHTKIPLLVLHEE